MAQFLFGVWLFCKIIKWVWNTPLSNRNIARFLKLIILTDTIGPWRFTADGIEPSLEHGVNSGYAIYDIAVLRWTKIFPDGKNDNDQDDYSKNQKV